MLRRRICPVAKKEKEAARWGDRETSDEDNAFLDGPPMARKASG